ncbi:peroxidase-like [Centruroides vittatus]|uniref:peroxidase-like n=1 Tax=Centruroides vittatus TaxID=120091 RepID=UPI00350EB118
MSTMSQFFNLIFITYCCRIIVYAFVTFNHLDFSYSVNRGIREREKFDPRNCALVLERVHLSRGRYHNDIREKPRETETCIRFVDVNRALSEAKRKTNYRHPVSVDQTLEPKPVDIAETSELVLEVTRILADQFRLSNEEIIRGLPLIDTSKTDIWSICPAFVKPIPCTIDKYRTYTAHCNNIHQPNWGATHTAFVRFLPPAFEDGISTSRISVTGKPLPSPRLISSIVHRDYNVPSEKFTVLFMSFGQFIDHDLTFATLPEGNNGQRIQCCGKNNKEKHPLCMEIEVPKDDPFFSRFNKNCLEFKRNLATQRPDCTLGPRSVQNMLTGPIDANFLYGSTEELARQLRTGYRGLMKTWDMFKREGLKPLLPPLTLTPERECIARPRDIFCFNAGDSRANEQIHLAILHTLYVREHNRIAEILGDMNYHWDDEKIYQETRRILAAVTQHITYNEYIPLLLNDDYLERYNLTLKDEGYWYGFNPDVHLGLSNSFQTAVFRFGHSQIQGTVTRYNKYHEYVDEFELRKVLRQPFILYKPGMMDELTVGMINTPSQRLDPFVSQEVTNHMFERPDEKFGIDLASINIQRSRDHGVPGYNNFREYCGFPRARTFEDLEAYLSNRTALKFSEIYSHPDDIDLWSAGISEYPLPGSVLGPTFSCLLAKQFSYLRHGDRFWYENDGFPSSFTPEQLREIRKSTQAKIICDNSDDLPTIQKWAMKLPHRRYNPRIPCEELPSINLRYWKEDDSKYKK